MSFLQQFLRKGALEPVPKNKMEKWRLIVEPKYLNQFLRPIKFKMENIRFMILLQREDFIAILIPHMKFLSLVIWHKGIIQHLQFTCISFRLAFAPYIFMAQMTLLAAAHRL